MSTTIALILISILVLFIWYLTSTRPLTFSNWNVYLEDFQYDSDKYYDELEEMLSTKNFEGIGFERVNLRKHGILSSTREYLRITYSDLVLDTSFYPLALGTYASSWSYSTVTGFQDLILKIPIFGELTHYLFYPETYYTADTRAMFQMLVHEAQLELVDKLVKQKGTRQLTEAERVLKTKSVFSR